MVAFIFKTFKILRCLRMVTFIFKISKILRFLRMVTFIDCIFFLMASMAADVECQARSGENDYDRSRSKIQDLKHSSSSVVSKWKIGLERTIKDPRTRIDDLTAR